MASTATNTVSRAQINRTKSKHSTGSRTEASEQGVLLTALPPWPDRQNSCASQQGPRALHWHVQHFLDKYQPASAAETQLVHELANPVWRQSAPPAPRSRPPRSEPRAAALDPVALQVRDSQPERFRQVQKTLDQLGALRSESRARAARSPNAGSVLEYR